MNFKGQIESRGKEIILQAKVIPSLFKTGHTRTWCCARDEHPDQRKKLKERNAV